MSGKTQQLSKEIVWRVRQCVIAAGAEFEGIQTSFTALPQVIFQTIDGLGHIYVVEFNPEDFSDLQLTQQIELEIAIFRAQRSTQMEPKKQLKEKLYAVYNAIDMIEKSGHNKGQNYDYIKAADVTREIRKQLMEQRVYAEINFDFVGGPFTIARAKEKDAPFSAVLVKCSVVFHDLDSDAILTGSGLGTGADTGDKAAYKAQTGALKYALKNSFLVPDEADPEADSTTDEDGGSVQAQDIPDFQEAKRGPAPRQERPTARTAAQPAPKAAEENPFESPASEAPSTKSQASAKPAAPAAAPSTISDAPDAAPEKGDAFEEPETSEDRLPTEEELDTYRKKFVAFGNNMADKGKLKASKSLPAPTKLKVFLLHITKAESPKQLTLSQWEDFFARVEKAVADPAIGFLGLAKLINKVNGIEDKK